MPTQGRPGFRAGLATGLFLTVPLTAIFYAGWRAAALPFPPFHFFDWQTRILPGGVVAAGIDAMVRAIEWLNLAGTSRVAKLAEQTMAVCEFILGGMILTALFFALLRPGMRREAPAAGMALGGLIGVWALWISHGVEESAAAGPVARGLWTVLLFVAWGGLVGWAYHRMSRDAAAAWGGETLERSGRRRFLQRLGGAAALVSVAAAALGKAAGRRMAPVAGGAEPWSANHPLPNAGAPVQPAPGTRPELTPLSQHYRIDINTTPPAVPEASWRLKIGGLVERPLEWTLADLRSRPAMHQFITLSCISNTVGGDLIGTTRWSGVSLRQLLPDLRLRPGATHLKIRSADGFYEIVALDTIRADDRVMLTYAWDGLPLAQQHGFPLRIYIPDRYGMKQPKWIESIEATDRWEPGYWVVRGWDREARMKAASVIDAVATNMMLIEPERELRIPVGGISHAGVRGISKVQVRVDGGDWMPAELRAPLSGQTWVLWRYDWPLHKGRHTFTVRCFEGDGTPQIEEESPPHPSGATGLHTREVMF